jgi:16S rRNA (cytosine967-C5)-methyltransferase
LSNERDERVKRLAGKIDRVLVDAPCSGLGTLRRNPDLKWRLSAKAIDELVELQGRILESACRLLKPGGRLVYATCSLLRREDEAIAEAFSAAHPEFVKQDAAELFAASQVERAAELCVDGYFRSWPHKHGMDGFFAAAWEKKS